VAPDPSPQIHRVRCLTPVTLQQQPQNQKSKVEKFSGQIFAHLLENGISCFTVQSLQNDKKLKKLAHLANGRAGTSFMADPPAEIYHLALKELQNEGLVQQMQLGQFKLNLRQ